MNTLRCTLSALLVLCAGTAPRLALAQDKSCQGQPVPENVSGRAFVIDGDTIAIADLKPHIRIWGIQAPELRDKKTGQESPAGMRARAALLDMIEVEQRHIATCKPTKWDRYCRLVASCTVESGDNLQADLGWEMLTRGMAYGYWLDDKPPQTPAGAEIARNYARAEADARKARTGLWPYWLSVGEK